MGIMIFMLKSQRRAFRWPNNLCARLYIIIIHCFIIFYILSGLQALTLNSTSSSLFHSLSQPSFYNIVHILTVTVTFLKYINILYVTLFKLLITQQVYNVSSVTRYLKSGIKSIKNFVLTSLLLLYITLINITLIIVNNCSMLNPGPVNPNSLSVFYQNIQELITFSSLASDEPSLSINKILELNSYIVSNHPDIVVLNETWLKQTVKNSEFFPDNDYKVFRLDRSVNTHPPDPSDPKKFRRNGGGVLITIKSTVDMNPKLVKSKARAEILYKKGDKSDIENYRPISLTSLIMKVLEKYVRDEIYNKCMHLINDKQHGFLPGKSCTTQLVSVVDSISRSISSQNEVDMIYFDFAKAFDSVCHDLILYKLKHLFKIDGLLLNFIKAYLQDRTQRVLINGSCSDTLPVHSGVPQGGI